MEAVNDSEPVIFHSQDLQDSLFHCVFRRHGDFEESYIYYIRGSPEFSAAEDEEPPVPDEISIAAYPNPFNSSAFITYFNLKGGEIRIFDIKGQLIRTFFTGDLENSASGRGENEGRIKWDATDASGKTVYSGIYFARAWYGSKATETSQSSDAIKLIYLK